MFLKIVLPSACTFSKAFRQHHDHFSFRLTAYPQYTFPRCQQYSARRCLALHLTSRLRCHHKNFYLADGMNIAMTIDPTSVVAVPRINVSVEGSVTYPDTVIEFRDVTFAYTHTGRDYMVQARYWMPAPNIFQNSYLSTGGGGFAINFGKQSLPGGLQYDAVASATDSGFGNFSINLDKVWLLENGTENWEALYMFGYHAIDELTVLGKLPQSTTTCPGRNSTPIPKDALRVVVMDGAKVRGSPFSTVLSPVLQLSALHISWSSISGPMSLSIPWDTTHRLASWRRLETRQLRSATLSMTR